jgi:PIN domain nuclease of toxin-antitoxin system
MKVLLDTHTLIWAALSVRSLSRRATTVIANRSNDIVVSAASAWEIATKVRLGKFEEARPFERDFLAKVDEAGYSLLAITTEHALRAGRLAGDHGDPFDRIIAAQALAEDIPIISIDPKLDSFGITRIW